MQNKHSRHRPDHIEDQDMWAVVVELPRETLRIGRVWAAAAMLHQAPVALMQCDLGEGRLREVCSAERQLS